VSDKKADPSYTIESDIDGWSFRVESAYIPGKCQERIHGIMEDEDRAVAASLAAGNVITDEPLTPPVVRVGVAAWIYKDGKVLMGKRKGSHGAGSWSLPGGHVDFGETPVETVAREIMEETGLEVGAIRHCTDFPYGHRFFPDDNKQYITLFFNAEYIGGEPMNVEPDKCEGWGWYGLNSLPAPLFGALDDEMMIEEIRKANA
jgi:8-oxo-dGTP diphosphatase